MDLLPGNVLELGVLFVKENKRGCHTDQRQWLLA